MVSLSKITKNGKALYIACDHGMEHGPHDLNEINADPNYIIDIAKKGNFTGIVFGKGISEKYNKELRASRVPIIVKLNGKTELYNGDPVSRQDCSVEYAVKGLGAAAIGYTIYIGSEFESLQLNEFGKIQEQAHKLGVPVITWIYPRGKSVKDPLSRENVAYAARVGLERGADIVKLHWNGKAKDMEWTARVAGKTKVVIAGGLEEGEKKFLESAKRAMDNGASGLAIGRNIWQHKDPVEMSKKLSKVVFG